MNVIHGDALNVLGDFPAATFDAVVTDPPYGLTDLSPKKVSEVLLHWCQGETDYLPTSGRKGFMNLSWDEFVPPPALWTQVLRVLKPGGYAAVFAGTRTQDLMGMSLRLAGFELRDEIAWCRGDGMPKARGVLKNGYEPILLVRRPCEGSARSNQARYGTGLLNAEDCRIAFSSEADEQESKGKNQHGTYGTQQGGNTIYGDFSMIQGGVRSDYDAPGRHPTNFILSHSPGCIPGPAKSIPSSRHHPSSRRGGLSVIGPVGHSGQTNLVEHRPQSELVPGWSCVQGCPVQALDDHSDHASRFFPAFTPDPEERFIYAGRAVPSERPTYTQPDGNVVQHSTIKPLAVMRWLTRLACPPGGHILDPFAGSGTTVEASLLEGFNCTAVERNEEYLPLIQQRIARQDVA